MLKFFNMFCFFFSCIVGVGIVVVDGFLGVGYGGNGGCGRD